MGSVVMHNVSNPWSAKKWDSGCGMHPFYRKFGGVHMYRCHKHMPLPVAGLMQMVALELPSACAMQWVKAVMLLAKLGGAWQLLPSNKGKENSGPEHQAIYVHLFFGEGGSLISPILDFSQWNYSIVGFESRQRWHTLLVAPQKRLMSSKTLKKTPVLRWSIGKK